MPRGALPYSLTPPPHPTPPRGKRRLDGMSTTRARADNRSMACQYMPLFLSLLAPGPQCAPKIAWPLPRPCALQMAVPVPRRPRPAARRTTQYWHLLERPPPPTALFLVQGERSDRWPAEQQHRLLAAVGRSRQGSTRTSPVGGAEGSGPAARAVAGRFEHHVLPRAGHWLHVDNPDGLLRLMLPYIVQL